LDLEKGKSIKEVVDGQQRTRTILAFCDDEIPAAHPAYQRKVRFSQLKRDEQQRFLLTSIPVGFLLGASDSDVIDIFGRINSTSKTLNSQEKRNAAFSGEMKQLCLRQSSSRIAFWRDYGIFTANDIARMNETQFISDLVYNFLNGLSDYSAKRIDSLYGQFDEEFVQSDEINGRLDRVFDCISSISPEKLSDTIFTRHPILFSLLIVIDSMERLDISNIEQAILTIDERFNSENNLSAVDVDFSKACTSSTQRYAQREIRDLYIRMFL
jgi:hypothetical protein